MLYLAPRVEGGSNTHGHSSDRFAEQLLKAQAPSGSPW